MFIDRQTDPRRYTHAWGQKGLPGHVERQSHVDTHEDRHADVRRKTDSQGKYCRQTGRRLRQTYTTCRQTKIQTHAYKQTDRRI